MADDTGEHSPKTQLIEIATRIFCAGMSFSGLDYLSPKEAVGLASDLIGQVDEHLSKPPA